VGAARLVEVDVRVNAAREHVHAAGVEHLRCLAAEIVGNRGDPPADDPNVRAPCTVRQDDGAAPHDQIEPVAHAVGSVHFASTASRSTNRASASIAAAMSGVSTASAG
jgi:hypothetical protein